MPDKSVRVTSRFPNGHSTIYFDLERLGGAHGFMLEQDRSRSEILVLRLMGGYNDSVGRYGDLAEAEADFTDLTTMLADQHHSPATASRSTALGAAKRGWGWKGAVAGLAIGAVSAHFATNWRTADSIPVRAATLGDAFPRPGARSDGNFIPDARPVIPTPQLAPPSLAAAPAKSSPASRPPSPAPSFGLQQ